MDKVINQMSGQVAALEGGAAELHLETINIEVQIEALHKQQEALEEKIETAVNLRNAIAEQAGMAPLSDEFFFDVQEGRYEG